MSSDCVSKFVLVVGKGTDPNGRIFRHTTSFLIVIMILIPVKVLDHLLNTFHGMIERFAPSMTDEKPRRLGTGSGWEGFNKGCLGFFGIRNCNVFVDFMHGNFLGSEQLVCSFIVSPFFLDTSSLHVCSDGTELTKVDSS